MSRHAGGAHLLPVGPRPFAHGARAAAAMVFDVSVGRRWSWLPLGLQAGNVLDADWREGEGHSASWWDRDRPRSHLPAIHAVAGPPRIVKPVLPAWLRRERRRGTRPSRTPARRRSAVLA